MVGVKVKINPSSNYPTPFGLEYSAKGFYIQKKHVIVVGNLSDDSTVRIKYPLNDVKVELIKHKAPMMHDWEVKVKDDNCVEVKISYRIPLEGMSIKFLSASRTLISVVNPNAHTFDICLYTGTPMFVEMHTPGGVSVLYAKGSGKDFYTEITPPKTSI
jgi:hypothetical protein